MFHHARHVSFPCNKLWTRQEKSFFSIKKPLLKKAV
ncbi:hypothetical protein U722_06880 [Bacillus amyloliquefaciens LFB112]|nr:hypothetical protein U722_06880 [Bacillus amyloliquefaciens LFB112]